MTRNELPVEAANIRVAVERWATCTPATVNTLRGYLLPGNPTILQEKSSMAASQYQRQNPTKVQGTKDAKTGKKKLVVKLVGPLLDGKVVCCAQDRWILATEVANIVFKILADSVKNAPAKRTVRQKPSPNSISYSASIVEGSDQETPKPLQPISVNRLSVLVEQPRRCRRSSSESASSQKHGQRAQAECACVAFAALRSMHLYDGLGASMPFLQLETGMSTLIGKLIALGFDDLAANELRILKRRLDILIRTSAIREKSGLALSKKNQFDESASLSKEPLEGMLLFSMPIDNGLLLALAVTSQLQALKLIYSFGTSGTVDASLTHLQLSCPYSPANLIDLQLDKTSSDSRVRVSRQLELLSQSLLALCSKLSPAPDERNPGSHESPSPATNFGLKSAVLEINLRRWRLLARKGNFAKEIIDPFAYYLQSFHRKSGLRPLENYTISRTAYQRLSTSAADMAASPQGQLWLPIYHHLADLAQEAGRSEESLQWLQHAMRSFTKKDMGSSKYCSSLCRMLNIRLGQAIDTPDNEELLILLKDARENLNSDLRGEPLDFDDLVNTIFVLRRLAFSFLHKYQNSPSRTEATNNSEIIKFASDLILLGLKFFIRYVSIRSKNEVEGSRYNHPMQVIWNNAALFVETIAAMTRYSVTTRMLDWEELEIGLRDCTWLVTASTDPQYNETLSAPGPDSKGPNPISISNAYWCRYLYLKQKGDSSPEVQKSLHKAIDLLRSRPAAEKLNGLLPIKLEKLGSFYEASRAYAKANDHYAEALRLLVRSETLKSAVIACATLPMTQAVGETSEYSILGRLLDSYIRAASKLDKSLMEGRSCFDDENLRPDERGLLLERQLIALSSIIRKKGPSPNISQMVQEVGFSLLSTYETFEFPIRRLRVLLQLSQLRSSYPMVITVNIQEQISELRSQSADVAMLKSDSGLHRFRVHLLQCCDMYIAFPEIHTNMQVLEGNLALWSTMLQDATWNSVCEQVNDVAQWIFQLQFLADYLEMQGLDFLRIRALYIMANLEEIREPVEPLAVISSLSMLASMYTRLGYSAEAGEVLQKAKKYSNSCSSTETVISWSLANAEYWMNCGNVVKAEEQFTNVLEAFRRTTENESAHGSKVKGSLCSMQLKSDLNYISSLLSVKKDDLSKAMLHARLHVKLSYRIWSTVESQQSENTAARLVVDEPSECDGDNVASQMANLSLAKDETPSVVSPDSAVRQSVPLWSTIRRLFHGLAHLSRLFARCGLFPEARYYMEQGLSIVEAAQASSLRSQALSYLGDYLIRSGDIEKGIIFLQQAEAMQNNIRIDPHMVSVQLFKANYYTQIQDAKSASDAFDYAGRLVEQLQQISFNKPSSSQSYVEQDLSAEVSQLNLHERPSTRRLQTHRKGASKRDENKSAARVKSTTFPETITSPSIISVLSSLKATILRKKAAMATSMRKFELAAALLFEAANIPGMPQDIISNQLGAGKLYLRQAIEAMADDPVFCVLPESTTSQPSISAARGRQGAVTSEHSPKKKSLGSPSRLVAVKGTSRHTRIGHKVSASHFSDFLVQAYENFLRVNEQAQASCSTVIAHRLTDLLTRTIVMLSACTGSQARGSANTLFALYVLELGKVISIVRAKAAVQVEQQISAHRVLSDWPVRDLEDAKTYTAEKSFDFPSLQSLYIDIIPSSWTVLSISLSESQDEVRVARVRSGQSPFILTLPLTRHSFRDPGEEYFGFKAARDELREIVTLANFSAHDAQDMNRKGARSEWWEVRAALDARLHELLVNIENVWLGGFRGIFSQHEQSYELLSRFQQSLQNILDKHLPSRQKHGRAKQAGRITLDPRVLELFVGLGNPTELNDLDEPLMDLLYFVIDILQFHGEHNAYDEIDFDSISIEIIDALRHYHKAFNNEICDPRHKHTILILDKTLHCFPWESLPCLREHAVSRLPSLASLRDLILQQQQQDETRERSERSNDGFQVDRRSGAAILNPSADLKATQALFEPALKQLPNWHITIKREPCEDEIKSHLETRSVFLYFGHGSGAQYIRSRTIKKLEKCAVTLLMGCSSGVLNEVGEFEPYGTPLNYIQGGCPSLVANLWDVTDRDIDKFSFGALAAWGLFQDNNNNNNNNNKKKKAPASRSGSNSSHSPIKRSTRLQAQQTSADADTSAVHHHSVPSGLGSDSGGSSSGSVSLDRAVAQSRDLCKLRYLNGAAPVVYGIPVFLT